MSKTNRSGDFLISKTAALFGLITLLVLGLFGTLSAQTVNQGYNSDEPLQKGMLVVSKQDDPNKVERATNENIDRLKGVVVQQNDSPVTLAGEGQNVFVATNGEYEVLVSNESGPIKRGDYLSVSSLAGIAMKATDEQPVVLGQASADFAGSEDSIGSYQDPQTKQTVNFGRILVSVSISRNPLLREDLGSRIPAAIQRISVAVAGKQVNTARVWLAVAVFLGTVFVVGTMLYSGARSSLISVGRNPLSRAVIIRGLLQVVVLSVIVFITGMFGVYLLLKL